ncbi:MAG: hypothetical protein ACPL4C_01420 [Brevinematia bacterium]
MLLGRVWKYKFNVIVSLVFVFLLYSCSEDNNQSTTNKIAESQIIEQSQNDLLQRELKNIKVGLGEKFLMEGVDFLSTMNFDRAIFSLNKSVFYNPIPIETKYLLAKSYLNSGNLRNAIDTFEEIKDSEYSSFVLPKLASIYSRMSRDPSFERPVEFVHFTNIYGVSQLKTIFSLPTFVRFYERLGFLVNYFTEGNFVSFNSHFSISKFYFGKKFIDLIYDEEDKVFYLLDFDKIYVYKPFWFNSNIFNLGLKKEFNYSNVSFKRFDMLGEWLYVIDAFENEVIVINKFDGKVLFKFSEDFSNPSCIRTYQDRIFVADGLEIKVFDKFGNFKDSFYVGVDIKSFTIYRGRIYIVSSKGVFVFSTSSGNIERTISQTEFDDIAIGYDSLFLVSKDRSEIEVFKDFYLLTSNLDVDIKGIFVNQFPMIGIVLGIRDINGRIVRDIRNNNIEVFEDGVNVLMPEIVQTYSFLKKKYLYVVVEQSEEIVSNYEIIEDFVRGILDRMPGDDYISLSVVGDNVIEYPKTNISVLKPLSFLEENFSSFSYSPRLYDGIRKAIDSMIYSLRNNAILVITSGREDDYSNVRFFNLLEYAYNNFIPIYFVSLSNNEDFKFLASYTGGVYYDKSALLAPGIFLGDYYKNRVFRYLVVFRSVYENIYPDNKLVDVEVRVRYNNMFGKDKIKYLFPKLKKPQE